MPSCPAGHASRSTDYCDECGLPIPARPSAAPTPVPPAPQSLTCPHCGTLAPADALFCEQCGYDFVTGTMPRGTVSELLGLATPPAAQGAVAVPSPTAPPTPLPPASTPASSAAPPPAAPVVTPDPVSPVSGTPATPDEAEVPTSGRDAPAPTPVASVEADRWVAELWIDPDWYRLQDSPDPLPSPGLPEIFPLTADGGLIGRVSRSQHIDPEVDCGSDTGCSRRQARLTTDGRRWWVEDQGSANGTFVGTTGGPLPTHPISTGRTELNADSRIYVGAWTRIVVRRATEDEETLFP
jgi:hypothetical protein